MKLIIFGATGKIGRNLVDLALGQGHSVTAFTRCPKTMGKPHKNLQVVKGDVLDNASVASAIQGHDAVLCALGMPLSNKEGLRAKGTKNIITAMKGAGVQRLICLSGLGVGDSRAMLPFHYKFLILPLILRNVYADHRVQESYVKNSALDWTIVRPGNFVKGKHTGTYRHGFATIDKSLKLKISHADVADFMLRQLGNQTYLRQTPSLSY